MQESYTHPTNHGYFDYGKNPENLQFEPHARIKGHRFWDLPCISVPSADLPTFRLFKVKIIFPYFEGIFVQNTGNSYYLAGLLQPKFLFIMNLNEHTTLIASMI